MTTVVVAASGGIFTLRTFYSTNRSRPSPFLPLSFRSDEFPQLSNPRYTGFGMETVQVRG